MARRKGETFPSDHRRWFRVAEDILDDETLNSVDPDVFRFYFRLLAMLNRTKARDGKIVLDRFALNACAMREQRRHALRVARAGAEAGLYRLSEDGEQVSIHVSKWAKFQELAPTKPRRRPNESPATTPTPKTTPTPTKRDSPSRQGSLLDRGGESGTPEAKAEAAWPAIRSAFAEHGKQLREGLGKDRRRQIAARIRDGATEVELVAAVHGYVVKHRGLAPDRNGYDPSQWFEPDTVFKATGFSARVEAGMGPRDLARVRPKTPSRSVGAW